MEEYSKLYTRLMEKLNIEPESKDIGPFQEEPKEEEP